ncbi:MAG: hypothetical protein PHT77_10340 [Bacteroidales bacterium]|nr:hypothetical protein [Bacteroidales bacterium]
MAWKKVIIEMTGDAPLLMHKLDSDALVKDPEGPRKGTPEWIEWCNNEWKRTAYWKEGMGLYVPGSAIEGTLRDSGKGEKENKKPLTKLFQSAFYCDVPEYPLEPAEPIKTLDDIEKKGWIDSRGVRIGKARIQRKRVCIPSGWKCTVTGMVDTDQISKTTMQEMASRAGEFIGILDWRPKYGRFKAVVKWK